MAVPYLQSSDYANYGITGATAAQVAQASRLIDGFCRRSRYGLIWEPDANGSPAYMAGASPDMTWTSAATISPGQNVTVVVTGAQVYPEIIGRTVTLDIGNAGVTEVCVITGVNSPSIGNITLGHVQFTHTGPVTLQGGLQIFEEKYLPQDRSIARLSHWPIAGVKSGIGRYSYGRRSQQATGNFSEFNLLAILQQFGGPPAWVPFDPLTLGINPNTGEVWIPAGVLLAYYSETRLWYVAGWQQSALPEEIKQACANIVSTYMNSAPMPSSQFRSFQAGDTKFERFADTALDDETKQLLLPFRARLYV